MTYDSPLSAFGGEVISKVANFTEEGFVTQIGVERERGNLQIDLSMWGIEPGRLHEQQECGPLLDNDIE